MVHTQIRKRGIKDLRLLAAMEKIPRHQFVPVKLRKKAYNDEPLPIGLEQTISQPYVVAFMIEQLKLTGDERLLEIGTGSGYQTAILAELAAQVYSVEILPKLSLMAETLLKKLCYQNIHFKIGDGNDGWEEKAPFDAIIVSAAPKEIPQTLLSQLKIAGRMIIPVGDENQTLYYLEKSHDKIEQTRKLAVRFVPMTGNPPKE